MAKKKSASKKFTPKKRVKRDLKKEIMDVFFAYPNKIFNYKQVASALGVTDGAVRIMIHEFLKIATKEDRLLEIDTGKFKLKASSLAMAEGVIQITKSGRGFVLVDGREDDISVRRGQTGTALWGDTVEVAFSDRAAKPEGKVVQVIKRARSQYVGSISISKNFAFCVPTDSRIHVDFFIPMGSLNGAKAGEKVVVEIVSWDNPEDSPVAKVTKVLGKAGEHNVEMHAILAEYGLPVEFPDEIQAAADAIDKRMHPEEIARRRDIRGITTFTIDPVDAKDFDDALSIQKLDSGRWEIGIHIADVSFYLKEGSPLDLEAYERATSVYLVDRTIPMLPEVLSNELCSLRPDEDKYCFSAIFELDEEAVVKERWFGRTIIRSDRRFTYEQAQEIIEGSAGDFSDEILTLDGLAKKMRGRRNVAGGIDFNTEEVRFRLDENGHPIEVQIKVMKDSNRLIEDFMLLANTEVAAYVGKQVPALTFVYRIHDEPDIEKLHQLRQFVMRLGVEMPKINDENSAEVLRDLMRKVEQLPAADMIKQMAIRTMAKAVYSIDNIGHYGLSFDYYSHFTSPIRRYPDVMVHRLLQRYLDGGNTVEEKSFIAKCRHSSAREKLAADAERASIKYKQVEYMADHIGEVFPGIISGMTGWGLYVELESFRAEGMVLLESIPGDQYTFDEKAYMVRGKRRGSELHLGDEVQIKVVAANLDKRQLDFEMLL